MPEPSVIVSTGKMPAAEAGVPQEKVETVSEVLDILTNTTSLKAYYDGVSY